MQGAVDVVSMITVAWRSTYMYIIYIVSMTNSDPACTASHR